MLFRYIDSRWRALLVLLAATACDAAPGAANDADSPVTGSSIVVEDLTGRAVQLERPAQRVAVLMPALSEWIIAMGAADRLIARTDYDSHPDLAHLPSLGGGLDPSLEWLAARQPDLVLAWPDTPGRSLVTRLEDLGIAVYTAPVERIEEALTVARDLGRLLGSPDSAAAAIAQVRAGLDSLRGAIAGEPAPAVLYLIGLDPLMAAGHGTFVDQLIRQAGGRNVLGDLTTLWPQLSLEEVIRRRPDVVVVASASVERPLELLRSRPGWQAVPAVRHGRVYRVDPDRINRPGPNLDESAARLAELFHP